MCCVLIGCQSDQSLPTGASYALLMLGQVRLNMNHSGTSTNTGRSTGALRCLSPLVKPWDQRARKRSWTSVRPQRFLSLSVGTSCRLSFIRSLIFSEQSIPLALLLVRSSRPSHLARGLRCDLIPSLFDPTSLLFVFRSGSSRF